MYVIACTRHNTKHVLCSNVSLLKASSQSVPSLKELSESSHADNHIIKRELPATVIVYRTLGVLVMLITVWDLVVFLAE